MINYVRGNNAVLMLIEGEPRFARYLKYSYKNTRVILRLASSLSLILFSKDCLKFSAFLVALTAIDESFSVKEHPSLFLDSNLTHLIAYNQLLNDKASLISVKTVQSNSNKSVEQQQ